jgi:ubiquitin conjugation factor E4 B
LIDANFITQVFVLTLSYLHYGPVKTFVDYRDLAKACNDFKQEIEEYERNQAANATNAAMTNMILQRGKVCLVQIQRNFRAVNNMDIGKIGQYGSP